MNKADASLFLCNVDVGLPSWAELVMSLSTGILMCGSNSVASQVAVLASKILC